MIYAPGRGRYLGLFMCRSIFNGLIIVCFSRGFFLSPPLGPLYARKTTNMRVINILGVINLNMAKTRTSRRQKVRLHSLVTPFIQFCPLYFNSEVIIHSVCDFLIVPRLQQRTYVCWKVRALKKTVA